MTVKKALVVLAGETEQIQSGDYVSADSLGSGSAGVGNLVLLDNNTFGPFVNNRVLICSIDGSGGVITNNSNAILASVPSNGTIISWYVVGRESSGSIQIDLLRWNGSSYVSIIGAGNKPIISSAQRANAIANGSWTSKTLVQYDELKWNVDSCTTFTFVNVVIFYNIS